MGTSEFRRDAAVVDKLQYEECVQLANATRTPNACEPTAMFLNSLKTRTYNFGCRIEAQPADAFFQRESYFFHNEPYELAGRNGRNAADGAYRTELHALDRN